MSKIVVIGEIMLDHYLYGNVDRISPEAPVPIVNFVNQHYRLGGAANVAANIKALGGDVTLISTSGYDTHSSTQQEILTLMDINNSIFRAANIPTIVKTRIKSGNAHLLRLDYEKKIELNTEQRQFIVKQFELHTDCEVLVISDYNKGLLDDSLISLLIDTAKHRNIKVLVDTKRNRAEPFKGVYLITPNEKEVIAFFENDLSIGNSAYGLIEYFNIQNVLLTKGSKGMTLHNRDAKYNIPAISKTAVDVSGAGDTVIATMAVNIEDDIFLATRKANLAASIVVNKPDTDVCYKAELDREIYRGALKIHDINSLMNEVHKWKASGEKIGFVNGCFDLLHAGHLHFLKEAKSQCTKLIVALNSDEYVKKSKGKNRPISTSRDKDVAAISEVDAVIMFEEDTPANLITMIKPYRLIAGSDYTIKDLDKLSPGINLVILPRLNENLSTRKILNE